MKLVKASLVTAVIMMATAPISSVSAAGAYWYVYASKVNGHRICAQYSPGSGWYKASSTAYPTLGHCNYYGR
ncbi:hypothetical protein SG34_008105 [Thalassomonas viridans]|uniref:Uncharacterized protein n=1 Tax=Thalassomonas viridans TaxID=137584 RepID=A0AAE9Z808_9GAMM|nr:hypothetical protein [Thalassomonas viridans]WDE08456.1 hypothetical protein SG34_008105 [Thalassomonas viridans]